VLFTIVSPYTFVTRRHSYIDYYNKPIANQYSKLVPTIGITLKRHRKGLITSNSNIYKWQLGINKFRKVIEIPSSVYNIFMF
jgi:hypothetical protein